MTTIIANDKIPNKSKNTIFIFLISEQTFFSQTSDLHWKFLMQRSPGSEQKTTKVQTFINNNTDILILTKFFHTSFNAQVCVLSASA